jgi:hypothetical protein
MKPCSPLKINLRFRGNVASIFRVEEEAKQELEYCYMRLAGFFLGLFFNLEARGHISSKTSVDFQRTTQMFPRE